MPLFDYVCPEGHSTEKLTKVVDGLIIRAFVVCPVCGKEAKPVLPIIATPQCFGAGVYKQSVKG